jgi:hypothetical protein
MTPRENNRKRGQKFRARARDLRRILVEEEGIELAKSGKLAGFPKITHSKRKKDCGESLELFAKTYLPHVFYLPFSEGQREDFKTMQAVVLAGGRYAFASPRGDGKTSRVEAAILWAALYGYRHCIVVVGADKDAADEIVESVKTELRTNELLREDFPVPCWAALLSDDVAMKAKHWTWGGKKLGMAWNTKRVILPNLPESDGAGCVIVGRGLTGRLRGMRIKVGKRALRPDLFAVDDPQTDESAASATQVKTREKLILGAILGSGGPGKTIAAMLPCTVIKYGDVAHRMLDRKRHPDWQGRVRAMVKKWPKAQKALWKQYFRKRREESEESATTFYKANRKRMDAGAKVDWAERYTKEKGKELSALQHAENLLCDLGEEVFDAEYQNSPDEQNASVYQLTADLVASRIHVGRKRGQVPTEARVVVAATDLNHYGLHTTCVAFANDQTAWIPEYTNFDRRGKGIIPKDCPEPQAKQLMYQALVDHGPQVAGLPLMRDRQSAGVGMWIIDAGYMPDVVKRYVEGEGRRLGLTIMPARGYNFDRYRPTGKNVIGKPREQCHHAETLIAGHFIAYNACYWREVAQKAWLASPNAPGSISLFEGRHREFAEQVTRIKLVEKLRGHHGWVWRWHTAPGWHDYADTVTMAYVGAAWSGIGTAGPPVPQKPKVPRRRVKHIPI